MGKVLQGATQNGNNWGITVSEVAFSPLCMGYGDDGFGSTEENQTSVSLRKNGVFSGLSVTAFSNSHTLAAVTTTFRKNGATGNQTVSIPAGTTGVFSDTSNSDSLSAGDTYNARMEGGATGTGNCLLRGVTVIFQDSSQHSVQYGTSNDAPGGVTASTTYYNHISGDIGLVTTENEVKQQVDVPGTFSNLQAGLITNTRSSTTTIRFRVNNANGNQVLSIGAGVTGLFHDSSNTDVITAGDDVNFTTIVGTGTGVFGIRNINITFTNPNNQKNNVYASVSGGETRTPGSTMSSTVAGTVTATGQTESLTNQLPGFGFIASRLKIYVSVNNYTATSTSSIRKNGANGNQSVSIPSATTGLFEDTTNEDVFTGTDKICIQWINGTSGTGTRVSWFGLLMESGRAKSFGYII